MRVFVCAMMLAVCIGCVSGGKLPLMTGRQMVREMESREFSPAPAKNPEGKTYSFSVNNMMMRDFCSWLSLTTGVGCVYSQSLDGLSVSLDFRSASLEEIMLMFSRRYGVSAVRSGNTYYVGQSRDSDKAIYVRSVSGYTLDDVRSMCALFSVDSSKAVVTSNGVCIMVLDNDTVIKAVSALDEFSSLAPKPYFVCVRLLRRRKSVNASAGVDFVPVGNISAYLSSLSGRVGLNGVPTVGLDLVLGEMIAVWRFVSFEGRSTVISSGSELRVARRDISQYGVSSSSGAEVIQCGLSLKFVLRPSVSGSLACEYVITDRRLDSWRDGYPQTYSQTFSGSSVCVVGGHSLVGEFTLNERSGGVSSFLVPFVSSGESLYFVVCSVSSVPWAK